MTKLIFILVSLSAFWGAQSYAEESLNLIDPLDEPTLEESMDDAVEVAQGEKKKKKKKKKKKSADGETSEKKESLHDSLTGQAYGMAGCGLGSIVFGDKPGMMQMVAVTLNGTGGQTFAITSGTSNCGQDSKSGAYQFIENNKLALASEISRGQGETIDNLSRILGCSDRKTVGELLQKNFNNIYPTENATTEQIGGAIFESLKENKNGLTCKVIG